MIEIIVSHTSHSYSTHEFQHSYQHLRLHEYDLADQFSIGFVTAGLDLLEFVLEALETSLTFNLELTETSLKLNLEACLGHI